MARLAELHMRFGSACLCCFPPRSVPEPGGPTLVVRSMIALSCRGRGAFPAASSPWPGREASPSAALFCRVSSTSTPNLLSVPTIAESLSRCTYCTSHNLLLSVPTLSGEGCNRQVVTRLTPAATITSSVALSNLLSGPAGGGPRPQLAAAASPSVVASVAAGANVSAASPKRRFSDATSDGSDAYYHHDARPRKSPRPNPQHGAPLQPSGISHSSSATIAPGSGAEVQRPGQQHPQPSGQSSQRHAQARMRSSIACVRCRRSKVKCVNSGVGTPCRSCEAGGRECTYPVPVSSGRRRESVAGQAVKPEGLVDDQIRKPRQQRKSNAGLPGQPVPLVPEATSPLVDVLDSNLLTSSVWQELFDIFQLHFSTDLPFIHPPTFLKPLRQANALVPQYKSPTRDQGPAVLPPASPEFLLAFLALTARFHPKLVAHHSSASSSHHNNALVASEFYASAAATRIKTVTGEKLGLYDLETTQALLMLVLHNWGMNRGEQAWAYLGIAIRSAQAMGLHYETDLDDAPLARCIPSNGGEDTSLDLQKGNSNDNFVQSELRRRTAWACFIFDRYLSNGKYRPQAINVNDIHIQLPASEQAFLFGEQVRTLKLGEESTAMTSPVTDTQSQRRASLIGEAMNGTFKRNSFPSNGSNGKSEDEQSKWEVGAEEGLVSRYIKILDVYGKIVKWACGGGRKSETLPPWNRQSQWFSLRQAVEDFRTSLPRQHVLTPQNTSAHVSIRTSTPYTLVHITVSLCQILLYREFLPFIPFRHGKPQGPSDGTTRTSITDAMAPQGFWEDGGRECLSAARDIVDLVRTCQEWGVAIETPIIGFAVYNVALLGVYLINFPWMDVNGYLRRSNPAREDHVPHGAEAARKALEMIGPMRTRLHMAEGWLKTLKRAHKYFSRLRTAWFDSAPRMMQGREREIWNDQSIATAQLHPPDAESTRVLLERQLADIDVGDEDSDSEMAEVCQGSGSAALAAISDVASPPLKQEGATVHNAAIEQHAQQEERWNAINSVAAAASALSTATSNQGTPAGAASQAQQANSAHFRFFSSRGPGSASPSTPTNYGHHSFRVTPSDAASPNGGHQQQRSPHVPAASASMWTSTNGSGGAREAPHSSSSMHGFASSPSAGARGPASMGAPGTPSSLAAPGAGYNSSMQQKRPNDKEIRDPEAWLAGLEKTFGADDLAAFVDGAEVGDVARGLARGGKGGWLGAVLGVS